ncbi:MAG: FxsA family protein [Paracoccus sp. (in: a-proteobacteria)]|nr:FxsA family protein [Paracoccus sp. (in: a-proteobacteria)]
MPLFILLILIPIIEIALFIQIGGIIGVWPTIAWVLLSALLGVALIRSQGQRALGELQRSYQTLSDPTRPLADGAMIMISGLLLVVPGFLTDAIGLLLLIPGIRDWLLRRWARNIRVSRAGFGFDSARDPRHGWGGRGEDDVIEGDYAVQEDPYVARDDLLPPETPPRPGHENRRSSGWTRPD